MGDAPNLVTITDGTGYLTGEPDVIIIKGGSNIAAIWVRGMTNGHFKFLTGATAVQTSGGPTPTATGFTVAGSVVNTNAAGATYRWTAFRDNNGGDFGYFSYTQNNTDNRDITIAGLGGNTPSYAMVFGDNGAPATAPYERFRCESGDASVTMSANETADRIQSFNAGGIQVGNAAEVNGSAAATFRGFAVANSALWYAFASAYTGNATNATSYTDGSAGMTGDYAWVKSLSGTVGAHASRHVSHSGSDSGRWTASADSTTGIVALIANGITVNNGSFVNASAATYATVLFKNGATAPIVPSDTFIVGLHGIERGIGPITAARLDGVLST